MTSKTSKKKIFLTILGYGWLIPAFASLVGGVVTFTVMSGDWDFSMTTVAGLSAVIIPVVAGLLYWTRRRKLTMTTVAVSGILLAVWALAITLAMLISSGNVNGTEAWAVAYVMTWLMPGNLLVILSDMPAVVFITCIATYAVCFLVSLTTVKPAVSGKLKAAGVLAMVSMIAINAGTYINRPEAKYGGYGFDYMGGWSSTDFTDYMVYSENSKLVTLPEKPALQISDPDKMPVMDGAEACYPVYAAMAKAVYKDIDKIEEEYKNSPNRPVFNTNGKIVTFTNTIQAFERLVNSEEEDATNNVDLFFGARPSSDQLEFAKAVGVDLDITPIGREGFVFFVEEDNPVDGLTSDQLRAIYHGDITNWSEVGGKDEPIVAFQRPENSGSQTMMKYFMGKVKLKDPMTYEVVHSMEGVVEEVAQYNNEKGALGYTFRYFLEGLNQEEGVKMLAIDGVRPTPENIGNGSYPLVVSLVMVTDANNPNPNVKKMVEFALSEDGQRIIEETGYSRVK